MASIVSKAVAKLQGRPPVAIEISPEGVLAAALPAGSHSAVYAYAALPAGAVVPGVGEPNLRAPGAVSDAIRSALSQLSPRTHYLSVVVPDTSIRVFVLDFDTLPQHSVEVESVLRFRLRKSVPFEVEQAGLGYQVLSAKENECKVLAAVMSGPIRAEYEAAVRAAGYEPGVMLPSALAAVAAIDSTEAVLLANLSVPALTTVIVSGQNLMLYRTLDLPSDPEMHRQEVQRGVAVAGAYFEDKLLSRPRQLYYAGDGEAQLFAEWLGDPELKVIDLVPRPTTGVTTPLGEASVAGVTGALAGAR
jgi:type IV pilus assembly protein PilM